MRKILAVGVMLGGAIALSFPTMSSRAIAQETCPNASHIASTTTRIVQLQQFGVQISIPENFRTMARQDSSVSILSPQEFNHIQCLNQGIPVLGTELESEDFRLLENPEGLSALEYAKDAAVQDNTPGYFASDTICIQTIDDVEVVMREISAGYDIAYAWYRLNDTENLVQISAFTKDDLLDLLGRTQFIGTPSDQI
ncbi:MAG: hypothetical protein AAGD25_31650 [Cyanobacteria bacterium P01_F01_bin.150]